MKKFKLDKYLTEITKSYILKNEKVWGKFYEKPKDRIVARTFFNKKKIRVSTVFLGLDHSWDFTGPPVLWETMVFGLKSEHMDRYTSVEDARKGHKKTCAYVRKLLKRRKKK